MLEGLGAWIIALEFTWPYGGIWCFGGEVSCVMLFGYEILV